MRHRIPPFAVIILAILALASCAARTAPVGAPARPTPQAWDMRTIVQVYGLPHGLGTGFVVDKRGLVVTNHHVVAPQLDLASFMIVSIGQVKVCVGRAPIKSCMKAEVVASDPVRDIALLKTEKPFAVQAELGDESTLVPYDEAVLVGNVLQILEPSPLGGRFVGTATKAYTDQKQFDITLPVLVFDLALPRGSSGGPVFDAGGRVVGMGRGFSDEDVTTRSFAIVIPISFVKAFVRKHDPFPRETGGMRK